MCKILALTNTKKLNLKKHINKIGNVLLKTERDGFGYAVLGEQGPFGEKTISNTFKSRLNASNLITLPIYKPKHQVFGIQGGLVGPGIFHGRTSTNSDGLVNTHPIQLEGWNLIHNGVVTDVGSDNDYGTVTDNDSEFVLYRLIQGIERVEDSLRGYYAFAAIDPKGRLHICRDDRATLFIGFSEVYDSFVIATTEVLLETAGKMLGAKLGPIEEIDENLYMVFEGNEAVTLKKIVPLGVSRAEARYSNLSLGRDILPYGRSEEHARGSGPHHRDISEAEYSNLSDLVSTMVDNTYDRTPDEEDEDLRKYQEEIENMDASYRIYMPDDRQIEVYDYHKLDRQTKAQCTIVRPDDSVVEPDYSRRREELYGS